MADNEDAMAVDQDVMDDNQNVMAVDQDVIPVDQDVMDADQNVIDDNQDVMAADQDVIENVMDDNQDAMAVDQDVIPVDQDVMDADQDVVAVDQDDAPADQDVMDDNQDVVVFGQDMLLADQDVVAVVQYVVDDNQDVVAVDQHVVAVDQDVVTVNQDVVAVDQDVVTVDQDVVTVDQDVVTVNQDVVAVDQDVVTVDQEVVTVDQDVVDVDQDVVAFDQDVVAIDQDVVAVDQDVVAVDQDVAAVNQDVAAVNQDVVAVDQDVAAVDQDVVAGDQDVVAVEEEVMPDNQDVVAVDQDVAAVGQDVVAVDQDVVAGDQDVVAVEEEVMLANQDIMDDNQHVVAADQDVIDDNQHVMPANQNVLPANQNVLPANQNVLPANQNVLPANQNVLPANQGAVAANQDAKDTDQDEAPTLEQSCIETIASIIAMGYMIRHEEPPYGRRDIQYITIPIDKYQKKLLARNSVVEALLKVVCKNGHLDDRVAEWFANTHHFIIKKLYLKMAAQLTASGLAALLEKHVLTEINTQNISEIRHTIPRRLVSAEQQITVRDILSNINRNTEKSLLALNVSGVRAVRVVQEAHNMRSRVVYLDSHFTRLSSLVKIQSLNVSNTMFMTDDLETVVGCMKNLKGLNISKTYVDTIACLNDNEGPQLLRLSMNNHNKLNMSSESLFDVFCNMTELRHLDISVEFDSEITPAPIIDPQCKAISKVLKGGNHLLQNLESLDISGRQGIERAVIQNFYINRPQLEFIGLLRTSLDDLPCFTDEEDNNFRSDVKVTGICTEAQIKNSLKCYYQRPIFADEALGALVSLLRANQQLYNKELLEFSLRCMMNHRFGNNVSKSVQTNASICVGNLTAPEFGPRIPTSVLIRVLKQSLDTLEQYSNDREFQTTCGMTLMNCLKFLHENRILKNKPIDYYKTAQHVMRCLRLCNEEPLPELAIMILSKLSAKMSLEQKSLLGSTANMQVFLQIVEKELSEPSSVEILNSSIDTLHNLIRERSILRRFHDNNGLSIFSRALMVQNPRKQTEMLSIMYNLAVIPSLRQYFLERGGVMITAARDLLRSQEMDVRYFAAGIISHLAMLSEEEWDQRLPEQDLREACLADLHGCVLSWIPLYPVLRVDCSTFRTFYPLVRRDDSPAIQLWALWAIRYFCLQDGAKYHEMLRAEQGIGCLEEVSANPQPDDDVQDLIQQILYQIHE